MKCNLFDNEFLNIIELTGTLIFENISCDPNMFSDPYFEEKLKDILMTNLYIQLKDVYEDLNISNIIIKAIHISLTIFYENICPKRSNGNSYIRITPNVKQMKKKLDYLTKIPQPEQRTEEWYEFRHGVLTASNIWKVFGTSRMQNEIIYEKCVDIDKNKFNNINTETPMHWGQKYEDVSIKWYENEYKTKISEFGCIPHKKHKFIAASPDGINTDKNSKLYGRMLEVKNIVNREINGIPKLEYWIQMQIQMEVCELNECDFLETKFIEYESKEDFELDINFNLSKDNKQKGIIMYFLEENKPIYEYAPLNITKDDFNVWETNTMNKYDTISWRKNIYWKLEKVSCVLVLRNKLWFNLVFPKIENIWNIIKKERIEGFEHRSPKRKEKINKKNNNNNNSLGKCLIDTNKIFKNCIFNIETEPLINID